MNETLIKQVCPPPAMAQVLNYKLSKLELLFWLGIHIYIQATWTFIKDS